MAGPSWLAGAFAAVMILTAAYSASRLAMSRLRGLAAESDADGLHAVMGAAMAGMLVPRLNLLPGRVWAVVFAFAAAWFAGRAIRGRAARTPSWQCRFPVPHLIECAAMLYMLLPARGAQHGTGMAMPGMGASPGLPASFPALAVVLAMFMIGYVMWTTDQLASLARAKTTAPAPATTPQRLTLVTVPAAGRPADAAGTEGTPGAAGTRPQHPAGTPVLAPRLAMFGKLAMGITMGYMLILML